MNRLITTTAALAFFAFAGESYAQGPTPPTAPTLAQALKLAQPNVVIFNPTRLSADASLNVSHIRLGDGSVKPGQKKAVMLLVFSSVGDNVKYYQEFHTLTNEGSPVLNFTAFHPREHATNSIDPQGRVGIIAILIGYQLNPRGVYVPSPLPALDSISAEVNPDDNALIGLLLPAVQKVRSAAAR
jgi:hypothetical protein